MKSLTTLGAYWAWKQQQRQRNRRAGTGPLKGGPEDWGLVGEGLSSQIDWGIVTGTVNDSRDYGSI